MLFILLGGVLAGAGDAEAVEDFALENEDWFRDRCGLPHGIPSQDTYLRVLAAMQPQVFAEAFDRWIAEVWGAPAERHVAIDGKSLRRSFERVTGRTPVHSVAAFASEQGLVLGQVAVDAKENEIVAIPRLLSLIDLRGAMVTIDAMGCQTAIAEAIVDNDGHYILRTKDNHPTLRRQIAVRVRQVPSLNVGVSHGLLAPRPRSVSRLCRPSAPSSSAGGRRYRRRGGSAS